MKALGALKEYKVVGCCLSTLKSHMPPLYQMCIFTPNHMVAKALLVFRISTEEDEVIKHLYSGQVFEKSPLCEKNFDIWLCSDSCILYHGYWDPIMAGIVTQCYQDMGARQSVHEHSIQIMKVEEIEEGKCCLLAIKQFLNFKIKFLLPHLILWLQRKLCFPIKRLNTQRPPESRRR